jgi:hypothetical protein
VLAAPASVSAQSYYPVRLDDPKAIYLTPDNFPVHADGVADDAEALQAAINKVQETGGEGILFVPPGRYRLTTTVSDWGGIRIVGYGEKRRGQLRHQEQRPAPRLWPRRGSGGAAGVRQR